MKKISSLLKSSEIRENLRYIFNIVTWKTVVSKNKLSAIEILQYFNKKLGVIGKNSFLLNKKKSYS